jgi:hypothetical protein
MILDPTDGGRAFLQTRPQGENGTDNVRSQLCASPADRISQRKNPARSNKPHERSFFKPLTASGSAPASD